MHSRIPLLNLPLNSWINLSIDVISFASDCFKSQTFRSIEFISITGNCKIRKIFSLRNGLTDNINKLDPIDNDAMNKVISFPPKLIYENVNINFDKVKSYVDNEIVNKYSQIINKASPNNNIVNNNFLMSPLKPNNNIVVITNNKISNTKLIQVQVGQHKKALKSNINTNNNNKIQKNVVFVTRKEINELGKIPNNKIRSKSNNPIKKTEKRSKENSAERNFSNSNNKVLLSTENNSNEMQNNLIEINLNNNNFQQNPINMSIKMNNFTQDNSLKSNKSCKKGQSIDKNSKHPLVLNTLNLGKNMKSNIDNEESIEELYELEDVKNNINSNYEDDINDDKNDKNSEDETEINKINNKSE